MTESQLTTDEYVQALEEGLGSMLSGCVLSPSRLSCAPSDDVVMREDDTSLLVRPDLAWPYCFRLTRSHHFGEEDEEVLREFLSAFQEKLHAAGQPFFPYLLTKCSQDVVSKSVAHRSLDQHLIPLIITTLLRWSSQTYEGQPISVAIGVDHLADLSRISTMHLQDIIQEDFAKVITNGIDTLLVISPSGHLVEHLVLMAQAPMTTRVGAVVHAPRRYFALADWAQKKRVALVLNAMGEILVFTKKRLEFAYRRGAWCYFSHDAMVEQLADAASDTRLGRAVYDSCLDASFARSGACVALVRSEHAQEMRSLLSDGDILQKAETAKSSTFSSVP